MVEFDKFLNVVIAQFPVSLSIRENLEAISAVVEQTEPGDLVLFPEGSVSGYSTDLSFLDRIDHGELHQALDFLQDQARERQINLWVGACVLDHGNWYNAAFGFTPDGKRHVYRKINLANHERGKLSTGSDLPIFRLQTPTGEISVGVQICREIRYPEQWGWLARQGAQIILHLNNAIDYDQYQPVWKSHLISRAAETQRFVLSANNAAQKQISPTIAIAPNGEVLAEIVSSQSESVRLRLDLSQVSNWNLDQCRTDVIALHYHLES
jgi:predicted amidohydrolase